MRREYIVGTIVLTALLTSCGLLLNAGITKLAFGCLPAGTPIDTPTGPVPIEKLHTGDLVIGYDGSPVTVSQIHQYQEDPSQARHLTVTFTNHSAVSLSPKHRIGGIPAGELRPGDSIEGNTVSEIRPLGGVFRSYDLLTGDRGYRIHGLPVDSMIEEMAGR